MKLSEFINHLAHKSLKLKIIAFDYDMNYMIKIFEGTIGELLHWVKYPMVMDFVVENVCPEDNNLLEVKIYG